MVQKTKNKIAIMRTIEEKEFHRWMTIRYVAYSLNKAYLTLYLYLMNHILLYIKFSE